MGDGGGDEREILRVEAQRTLFISHSPALLSRWCQLVRVLLDLQVSTPLGWRGGGGGGGRNGGNGRKADFLFLPFVAPLNGDRERGGRGERGALLAIRARCSDFF